VSGFCGLQFGKTKPDNTARYNSMANMASIRYNTIDVNQDVGPLGSLPTAPQAGREKIHLAEMVHFRDTLVCIGS